MGAQTRLMAARDRRASLMNEILGAIRMIKVPFFSARYDGPLQTDGIDSSWRSREILRSEFWRFEMTS
jgi:hypothetical protein